VFLQAALPVRLKSTFGHGYPLLFLKKNLRIGNRKDYIAGEDFKPVCKLTSQCGNPSHRDGAS
jgi:hypothetical protein